jgi:hypothetical protein
MGTRSDYEFEQAQKFNQHAAEARRANQLRAERVAREKQLKEDLYKRSLSGRYNSAKERALGGLGDVYHKGQKVAGVVGDVGRGAWELAKKFGRGALAFGRGLYKTGHALKKGAELGVEGAQIARRSMPDVKDLATTTRDLITGKMKREDFDNRARESLTNLGNTWTKPIDFIDEHMDNWANDHIEGSKLQDYAGRAASGLGEIMSMPERAIGGIANWWRGNKK